MSIKTKKDYIEFCKLLGFEGIEEELEILNPDNDDVYPPSRGAGPYKNLELLITYALTKLPRDDINMGSQSAKDTLATFLAKEILSTAADKNWWDKYHYSL